MSDEDTGALYFGSREQRREPSQLVVRWRTAASIGRPTDRPTFVPTWSPAKRDLEREIERDRFQEISRDRDLEREREREISLSRDLERGRS